MYLSVEHVLWRNLCPDLFTIELWIVITPLIVIFFTDLSGAELFGNRRRKGTDRNTEAGPGDLRDQAWGHFAAARRRGAGDRHPAQGGLCRIVRSCV